VAVAPKRPSTPLGRAFEGAFEAAIGVVVALLGGYYADRYFGTGYILTFVGLVLGGIAAVRRLLQIQNPPGPDVPTRDGSTRGSTDRGEPSTVRRGESHADRGENGSGG
jgi:F0F1-type ATP synthase assembly protein I